MQTGDPYGKKSKATLWWLIGGALALVGLIAFGLGSGILGLGGQRPASALSQQGDRPDPITPQVNSPVAPTTQISGAPATPITPQEAKRMPADILAWLQHLERTEAERNRISHSQIGAVSAALAKMSLGGAEKMLGELLGGDDQAPIQTPTQDVANSISAKQQEWDQLQAFFQSVPPPPACISIAQNYGQALAGTRQMMLELLTAIARADQSPEQAIAALSAMRGSSSERIDRAANEADNGLAAICAQYDAPKWFSVKGDIGTGAMGSIPSLPGG
jgi:hypothetical protein